MQNQDYKNLFITILSFGFKYGIPADSDLVFDVRFLPNPYYVEGLRAKTGNDKEIQDYVFQYEEAHMFLDKLEDMLNFLIPNLYCRREEPACNFHRLYRRKAPFGHTRQCVV